MATHHTREQFEHEYQQLRQQGATAKANRKSTLQAARARANRYYSRWKGAELKVVTMQSRIDRLERSLLGLMISINGLHGFLALGKNDSRKIRDTLTVQQQAEQVRQDEEK